MIKVGSDFSGVGAFDQALVRLGIDYQKIFACDWDKYARQTYIHNYGEPDYFPMDVYDREIPTDPLDIYMTSPPCQAFSLAGKRGGENDKRGILFYNSHEFILINRPRYFIFENVKGLLSDSGGATFAKWVQYLGGRSVNGAPTIFPHKESVPYHVYWKVMNAKNYGIPQNRERIFIIGIRDDSDNYFSWPREQFLEKRLRHVLEENVCEKYYLSDTIIKSMLNKVGNFNGRFDPHSGGDISKCITSRYHKMGATDPYIKVLIAKRQRTEEGKEIRKANRTKGSDTNPFQSKQLSFEESDVMNCIGTSLSVDNQIVEARIFGWHENENVVAAHRGDDKRSTVSEHVYHKDSGVCTTIQTAHIPKLIQIGTLYEDNGDAGRVYSLDRLGRTIKSEGGGLGAKTGLYEESYRIRRLTPRECFRLMDFPDTFTWPISDSQAYKQAGNSICVGVLAGLLGKLKIF